MQKTNNSCKSAIVLNVRIAEFLLELHFYVLDRSEDYEAVWSSPGPVLVTSEVEESIPAVHAVMFAIFTFMSWTVLKSSQHFGQAQGQFWSSPKWRHVRIQDSRKNMLEARILAKNMLELQF